MSIWAGPTFVARSIAIPRSLVVLCVVLCRMLEKLILAVLAIGCGKGASAGITCGQVFQCVAACNNDSACSDGCLARATAPAHVLMAGFADCLGQHGCKDEDCIRASCGQEFAACGADVATGPVFGATAAPANSSGELVTALAGRWLGRAAEFTTYELDGAGNVNRWLRVGTSGTSGHTTYTDQY